MAAGAGPSAAAAEPVEAREEAGPLLIRDVTLAGEPRRVGGPLVLVRAD